MSVEKDDIRKLINEQGAENLSAKKVREMLEQAQGLDPGSLKPQKETIAALIDEVLKEQGGDEEEEEEAPPPKKRSKSEAASSSDGPEEKKAKTFTCITRSGGETPKDIKKSQMSLMSRAEFLKHGETIEIDICGNTLTGNPRTFSSDNCGWYLGGKIEVGHRPAPPPTSRQKPGTEQSRAAALSDFRPAARGSVARASCSARDLGGAGPRQWEDRMGVGRRERDHPGVQLVEVIEKFLRARISLVSRVPL